jgi:hypothetical protein
MDFKVNIGNNKITPSLKSRQKLLSRVPVQAFAFFKAITPIKTGNARSHTVFNKNIISAAYPYAQRLDDGSSKQAPKGMSAPTENFIKKTVDKIIKGK